MTESENIHQLDLRGKICPYPVVQIIETVDSLEQGRNMMFLVDDPLAVKSVPEEIEDLSNSSEIELNIEKCKGFWKIIVSRD